MTDNNVYDQCVLTQKITLSITEIGKNIKQILEKKLSLKNEGKCIPEGMMKPNSIKIMSYSSGVVNMKNIDFYVVFECLICNPTEGQEMNCVVKTITKAGIHAEVIVDDVVPVVVFVARDHHIQSNVFSKLKENDEIVIKVIGSRYELNDPHIYVIGELYSTSIKMRP